MAKNWIIGITLMALVLGGLFLLGYIPLPDDNDSSMEIIFYDADGNELGRTDTLSLFGIQQPGIEGDIHSLDVVVYFKITTDIDYAHVTSWCDMSIETVVNTYSASVVHIITEHRLGALNTDLEGSFYATYLMSTLLPDNKIESVGKEYGWMMYFDATVTSSIVGEDDGMEVTDTCGTTLALVWSEGTASVDSWFGDW